MWRAGVVGICVGFLVGSAWAGAPLDLDRLDEATVRRVEALVTRVESLVAARRATGTLPSLTFGELYAPLSEEDRAFLDALCAIRPGQLHGVSRRLPPPGPDVVFDALEGQVVRTSDGTPRTLSTQYLPRAVSQACQRMMVAMQRDLGKRLLVESGYRSPAHQVYLFLLFLPRHGYSIRDTNRFVALPGYSEHGAPDRQAIDFISEDGVNGDEAPEVFEALEEYRWLQQHAREYGFYLSYPRGNVAGASFEPWHWHYQAPRVQD